MIGCCNLFGFGFRTLIEVHSVIPLKFFLDSRYLDAPWIISHEPWIWLECFSGQQNYAPRDIIGYFWIHKGISHNEKQNRKNNWAVGISIIGRIKYLNLILSCCWWIYLHLPCSASTLLGLPVQRWGNCTSNLWILHIGSVERLPFLV